MNTHRKFIDYLYPQKYYKLVGIDLSKQTKMSIPQQFNFVGKLDKENGATMLFVKKLFKTFL